MALAIITVVSPLLILFTYAVMITSGVILIVMIGSTGAIVLGSFNFVCVLLMALLNVICVAEMGTLAFWTYQNYGRTASESV
jgi:hypothetical protein